MKTAKNHSKEDPNSESEVDILREENAELKRRVAWFENQVFGQKSEKRIIDNPDQMSLLGKPVETPPAPEDKIETVSQRGKAKKHRPDNCVTGTGLRFSEEIPVEVVELVPDELLGGDADQYTVIDTHSTFKLAQRPASYVIIEYRKPVLKRIDAENSDGAELVTTTMPDQVLDNSIADVSVLAGLLVDKFCFHLPLYRQHQRMAQAGITLARSTPINWVKRSIELLRPIVEAQLQHILQSKVLAMDETPIKAGKKSKGKMKQSYFWPIYGEDDEVVFTFSQSRGKQHIIETISKSFQGTLLTDGYAAYARFAEKTEGVDHAQCWAHSRRKFIEAEDSDPTTIAEALAFIGSIYRHENLIREAKLEGDRKHEYRLEHSKPIVDAFFQWCHTQCHRDDLTPKSPLSKALKYLLNRESELKVFLENPDVSVDTNHLERAIRPITLGRKNWLFCWTELGAEHVGIIQSLISTCKLHGVNPHVYLVDVLQRISDHPASKVDELTPRLWKEHFSETPLRSVVDKKVFSVLE